nr:MAG TPA: hypothetical protein [Caudoviricetes sp.]
MEKNDEDDIYNNRTCHQCSDVRFGKFRDRDK